MCQLEPGTGTGSLGNLTADTAAQKAAGAVSAASHSGSQGACGRRVPLASPCVITSSGSRADGRGEGC